MAASSAQTFHGDSSSASAPSPSSPKSAALSIMVNSCTGRMGMAVIDAAEAAGLHVVPVSFGSEKNSGKTFHINGKEFLVHGPSSERERVLLSTLEKYPNLIVVDYTVSTALNGNAELYCKFGVPFVMGTTGGDRDSLLRMVRDSKVYCVIAQHMGKQLAVSQHASEYDASETARVVIPFFNKLVGLPFHENQIEMITDPEDQVDLVGVPREDLADHAWHRYSLRSPDETVTIVFQHNVAGVSIYAEGTVDAVIFLAKKVEENHRKREYGLSDILREGNLR